MFINVSITLLYQGFGRKQILLSSPSIPCEFNQDGLPLSPHSSAHSLRKSLSHSLTSSSLAIKLSKNSRVFVGMLHSVFGDSKKKFLAHSLCRLPQCATSWHRQAKSPCSLRSSVRCIRASHQSQAPDQPQRNQNHHAKQPGALPTNPHHWK